VTRKLGKRYVKETYLVKEKGEHFGFEKEVEFGK